MNGSDKTLKMAEQICLNLAGYSESDKISKLNEHFSTFWTPVMRRQLADLLKISDTPHHKLLSAALTLS